MRAFRRVVSGILLLILMGESLLVTSTGVRAQDGWEPVAIGIDYQEFQLNGPIRAFVARMERSNPTVTLESTLARGRLGGGFETTSGMARRYDQSLSYWSGQWGQRSEVVVAINGSFVEPTTGFPENGLVHGGWYAKRYDDLNGSSGFGWKMDRTAFIGECVYHREGRNVITFLNTGDTMNIDTINRPRQGGQLVLYTPQYGLTTRTNNDGVELVLEVTRPSLILPMPATPVTGIVRQIRDRTGSTPIPFDAVVLSGQGWVRDELLSNVQLGDSIGISQEITSLNRSCEPTSTPVSWTKTYASLGGSYFYLKNGEIIHSNDAGAVARHPRTAIAYNDTHIFFIVVDGRRTGYSIGMTIDELALFSRDWLGATWGINQDGGGSSTMVIDGRVVNWPAVPCYYVYQPMIQVGTPIPDTKAHSNMALRTTQISVPPRCERPVANGMMMVSVLEAQWFMEFSPGQTVRTRFDTELWTGPGKNYFVLAAIPANTELTVVGHNLMGLFATGETWWKVSYAGTTGWVAARSIALAGSP